MCVCASGSTFWIQIKFKIPNDYNIRLRASALFWVRMWVMYIMCLCYVFFPLPNKVQQVCKERKKKTSVREGDCEHDVFLIGIQQLAKCFTVSNDEQCMPGLSKMSQCAWIFLKIFCCHFSFSKQSNCFILSALVMRVFCCCCYWLCHRYLLHVRAADQGEKYPFSIRPLTSSSIYLPLFPPVLFTLVINVLIMI